MMLNWLRLINKNQRGITVIELIIAMALSSIIAGATTTTILQVINGSNRTNNHMTAVRQVQSAGYWVSHDAQMAQGVVITGVSGFPLNLTWTDWENGDEHQVVYSLEDMSGSLKNLQRIHSVNGAPQETGFVAQFIDPGNTNYEFAASSDFSLPDIGDEFTITDGNGGDSGTITVTAGSVTATPTGNATVAGGTGSVAIDPASGAVAWTTSSAGDTVMVAADSASTTGSWTATTGTATASITVDSDASLTDGGVLVFTVTATVGAGSQAESETRVYRVTSRPGS